MLTELLQAGIVDPYSVYDPTRLKVPSGPWLYLSGTLRGMIWFSMSTARGDALCI